MAKKLSQSFDTFDVFGTRKAEKSARQLGYAKADAASSLAESESKLKAAAAEKTAMEEANKKKLEETQAESRRVAMTDYLSSEGGDKQSRRKFLVGAK